MRILAIRGKNLASLADRFEVALDAEPLASAGLFAITGETGTGKSTILDALCLALYATCPRLSTDAGREQLPDTGEETISSGDPRSCLRRGAVEGFAEVDYIGVDGVRYRANWTARRARGRATGTLQKPAWSLKRIDDDTIVEANITGVRAAVERTTGLSFDQFRRAVLLAQGDFDALLRADVNARADLLEKITGTFIYREISKRAFEHCAEAERAVAQLEERRQDFRLLTEEDRTARIDEKAALEAASAATFMRVSEIVTLVARHTAIDAAEANLIEAKSKLELAQLEAEALSDERQQLSQIDRAEPLRPVFVRAAEKRGDQKELEVELSTAIDRVGTAKLDADEAAKAAQSASIAYAQAEQRFKQFGPVWSEATRLDADIKTASAEVAEAEARADKAEAAHAAACTAATDLEARLAAARVENERLESWLCSLQPLQPVAERWDEIQEKINNRIASAKEIATESAAVSHHQTELTSLNKASAALDLADQRDKKARDELISQLARLTGTLAERDEQALAERSGLITELLEVVRDLASVSQRYQRAANDAAEAQQRERAAGNDLKKANQDSAEAISAKNLAQAAIDALTGPLARAEDAASDVASDLRKRLVTGEPCPVCGSLEHPIHTDAALKALAIEMRTKLSLAEDALRKSNEGLVNAKAREASANARKDEARTAFGRTTAEMCSEAEAYSERHCSYQHTITTLGLPSLCPTSPIEAVAAIEQARVAAESARMAIEDALASVKDLKTRIEQLTSQRNALNEALEERLGERTRLQNARATEESALASARAALDLANRERKEIDGVLLPWLFLAKLTVEALDRDAAAATRTLFGLARSWTNAKANRDAAAGRVSEIEPKVTHARSQADALRGPNEQSQRDVEIRKDALSTKVSARGLLLAGENTDQHRTRINNERQEAQREKDSLVAAHAEATTSLAASAQAVDSLNLRKRELTAEAETAEKTVSAQLEQVGLDRAVVEGLLALDRAEVSALRDRLSAADRKIIEFQAAVTARSGDLTKALAEGRPGIARADLEAERQIIEANREEALRRIGSIAAELTNDDEQRVKAGSLEAEITVAKDSAKVWSEINAAVGSRNGDKFARFAQSVTLDLLVQLANTHLNTLKPRYRLQRAGQELGLHVIDREMGDDLRSTRSLSGGERFLVSLALALALSGLGGRQAFADTLFIDEGFGALDADSFETAIDALETLRSQGRTVGVISHVEAMKDRIPVQVRVIRQGAGRSVVKLVAPELAG